MVERAPDEPEREYRDETSGERLDRKWGELLQELRVMQTGTQLTAGFLLTLPFTNAFSRTDDVQRVLYLTLVLTAAVSTALVLAPVAAHRRLSGRRAKERLVDAADRMAKVALGLVAVLVVGMVVLVFDVTTDRWKALTTGGLVAALALGLLLWVPRRLVTDLADEGPSPEGDSGRN